RARGRPDEARGRRGAALRPLSAERRLPVPAPRRARRDSMSQSQTQRVQDQFGPSAAAYVASPGHAGGEDLERLLTWGRALRPARVLDIATGGGHTAVALAGVAGHVGACDVTAPLPRAAQALAAP